MPSPGAPVPPPAQAPRGPAPVQRVSRSKRRSARSGAVGGLVGSIGIGFILAAAVGAPLLAGGVHRPTLVAVIACAGLGLSILYLGRRMEGSGIRVAKVVILPLALLAIHLGCQIAGPAVIQNR